MASSYADENFRHPVVASLRLLGHDVLTCQEAGRADQGIDDSTVLADALRRNRIVLTQNRNDFKKLHRQGLPHQCIVVCTSTRTPRHWLSELTEPWPLRSRVSAGCKCRPAESQRTCSHEDAVRGHWGPSTFCSP